MTGSRVSLLALLLLACDPAAIEDAAPPDAGFDAGPPPADSGPACAALGGAYRTEMLLDPCFTGTPFRLGPFCITQDGCTAQVVGTHGSVVGTVDGDTLSFDTEGLQCTATRVEDRIAIACEDPAVSTSCTVMADAAPDREGLCCAADTDCTGGDRCAAVTLPGDSPVPVASACVAAGPGERGGACTTSGGIGTCGAGLTCTSGDLGDDAVECRTLCRADGDCDGTEVCVWYSLTAPLVGFCMQTCALGDDTCGDGATCDGQTTLSADGTLSDGLACRGVGTVAPGTACSRGTDCTAGHTCARPPGGELLCRPICGPERTCETGERCQLIGNVTAVAGACVPG